MLSNISTYALHAGLRRTTINTQISLNEAQKEAVTGRKSDIGLSLGNFTSTTVSLQTQISRIEQTQVTNGITENRLSSMQNALGTMVQTANDFMGQLGAELNSNLDRQLVSSISNNMLGQFRDTLNVTFNGEFIFSGVNSDVVALNDYEATGSSAKVAVQAAFVTEFGFAASDPLAANILPDDMKNFLDGSFKDLFEDPNWSTHWSSSSDRGVRSRISTREIVEVETTANSQGFRTITAASVMMAEFSQANLNDDTFNQLAKTALENTANGISALGTEQAKVGLIEERVSSATERLGEQKNILDLQFDGLTGVDPYEAATKLNQIVVSLEASYAATARIQSLSLMNYL